MAQQDQQVRAQPPGQRDRCLEVHGGHVARVEVVVAQIGVDPLVERFSETTLPRELETSKGRFSNDIRRRRQFDSPSSWLCSLARANRSGQGVAPRAHGALRDDFNLSTVPVALPS